MLNNVALMYVGQSHGEAHQRGTVVVLGKPDSASGHYIFYLALLAS